MDLLLARPLALPATRSATESSFGITNLCDLLSIPGSAASAGLFARDAMLSFHWYHRVGPLRTLHTLFLLGVTWRVLLRTLYTTQGTMCASGLQTVSEARGSARVWLHKCYLWVCKRISVYKQSSLCVTMELGELPIFGVKSVKIYTGQKNFTRTCPWRPWQIWGMIDIWLHLGFSS